MLKDLSVAGRVLARTPLFALVAAIMLGLGIGANTLMYSIVRSVLLRPLAGYETDRLARIFNPDDSAGAGFLPPEVSSANSAAK